MKYLGFLAQAFLGLSILSLILWIAAKFAGPIGRVGQDGFLLMTVVALGFVAAISLYRLGFVNRE
jgi:hypothetical protein